jgi:hypothetical protein
MPARRVGYSFMRRLEETGCDPVHRTVRRPDLKPLIKLEISCYRAQVAAGIGSWSRGLRRENAPREGRKK